MDNFTVGVVVFPGSNCDRDVSWALEGCLDIRTKYLWHESSDLSDVDAIVLPGGFSYGDYLRCGAIARFSPLINALDEFVKSGKRVLGICNGFQILTESGFLPGALVANKNLNFICDDVELDIISSKGCWFNNGDEKQTKPVLLEFSGVLKFPAPPHFEHFILSIEETSSEIICFKAIF